MIDERGWNSQQWNSVKQYPNYLLLQSTDPVMWIAYGQRYRSDRVAPWAPCESLPTLSIGFDKPEHNKSNQEQYESVISGASLTLKQGLSKSGKRRIPMSTRFFSWYFLLLKSVLTVSTVAPVRATMSATSPKLILVVVIISSSSMRLVNQASTYKQSCSIKE